MDLEGRIIWKNRDIHYEPVHGNGGSPVLIGNSLIFSCDGGDVQFVIALSRDSGKTLWKQRRPPPNGRGFSFSTPLVIVVNGKKQLISSGSDSVSAFDPEDGRVIWTVRYSGYSVIPRPVFGAGLVFVCTGYDRPSLLAIRPDGKGDVTNTHVKWKTSSGVPHTAAPLLVGSELYLVSDKGVASCLDAKTGRRHWRERIGGDYSSSPIHANGKIYFQSEQGEGIVVRASSRFGLLARNPLDERTLSSYAVSGETLFIRTRGNLYRIEKE